MTTTALKLAALAFMLFDHIWEFFPGAPFWFHWVGRLAAPLFFFCTAWGMYFSHNRRAYLGRLYAFGVGMALLDVACNRLFPTAAVPLYNNIFVTLFCSGCFIALLELARHDPVNGRRAMLAYGLWQGCSTVLCLTFGPALGYDGLLALGALTGNLLFNEGSFPFVLLGVLIYETRTNVRCLAAGYLGFCMLFFLSALAEGGAETLASANGCQWMMAAALPFFFVWNGQRGRGLKPLFYLFYPLHLVLLFCMGNLL